MSANATSFGDRSQFFGPHPAGMGDADTVFEPFAPSQDRHLDMKGRTKGWMPVVGLVSALAGLALAVASAFGATMAGVLAIPLIVAAVVLGGVSVYQARGRRGVAIAAMVIGLVALPLDAVATVVALSHVETASSTTTSVLEPTYTTALSSTGGSGADLYTRDQVFLQILGEHGIFLNASEEQSAVSLGHNISDYMSHGGTVSGAETILMNNGFTSYESEVIVADAVSSYLTN